MRSPGRKTQRFAVALLMATLLGPVGGGLAGRPMGIGMDVADVALPQQMGENVADSHPGHHAATATNTDGCHATGDERPKHDQMDGSDSADQASGDSHRCAGIWSTACCDYFAPGSKIKVEPSLASSSLAAHAPFVGAISEILGPAEIWSHLILPTAGEGRAGPTSLVILHSSLLL